jgi:hypothetical protein
MFVLFLFITFASVIFEILLNFYFFLLIFFFPFFFGFLNIVFEVFNFNCSFLFCFVCVWEKVNPSFVCWAIVQTKTHATCKWDHL